VVQLSAFSPLDGRHLGDFPETDPAGLQRQIAAGRRAASLWSAVSVPERLRRLQPLRQRLIGDAERIVDCIRLCSGKTRNEALTGELYPVLELLAFYRRHAERVLAGYGVATSPLLFPGSTAQVERKAFGLVAVFAPWNYPFQLALAPLLTALIAGNAVILKPSELALPTGELIVQLFAGLDLPEGLLQWVAGGPEVGTALVDAGPDLVFFTGGLEGGKAVMRRAAEHPIPVILELGGKDPMLVFADADLTRAASGALYGAFANSGQVCVSVERLLVQRSIVEPFLAQLRAGLQALRTGPDDDADLGAMVSERQIERVKAHYDDAIAQGAAASGPFERAGRFVKPVLLWKVTPEMRVMREETFGPLLPVMAFDDEADAIALANACDCGLNASVWSRDIDKAERVARVLQVGNWAVNDVIKNIGHAGLPFGGVKRSGFGRYHGAEGLLAFSYPVAGLTNRSRLPGEPNWFPHRLQGYRDLLGYMDFVHGDGNWVQRGKRNWPALQALKAYSAVDFTQRWHNLKLKLTFKRGY